MLNYIHQIFQVGQHSTTHQNANLLHYFDASVSCSPGLFADAYSPQKWQHRGDAECTGYDSKSTGSGVAYILILVVDIGSHGRYHRSQTRCLRQVRNDFTTLNSCVVVLIDE